MQRFFGASARLKADSLRGKYANKGIRYFLDCSKREGGADASWLLKAGWLDNPMNRSVFQAVKSWPKNNDAIIIENVVF